MNLSNKSWGKALLAAAVGLALTTAPAAAEAPQSLPEFDSQVRDVLLRNPEIILEVFALLEQKEQASKALKDQEIVASVADELFAGLDPEKPILVEFQDYNCGYCRKVHAEVQTLKTENPDLQVVIMEMPILGTGSDFTAKVALALKELKGEAAYQEFSDEMMTMPGQANAVSALKKLAMLGHDPEELAAAAKAGVGSEDLEKATRMAAAVGATGTPYFVGPSGIIRGAANADQLKKIAIPADAQE